MGRWLQTNQVHCFVYKSKTQFRQLKLDFLCFSHWFSEITFLLLILVSCVRDESFREKLAPTSPSGSNVIDAAISSAQGCTL